MNSLLEAQNRVSGKAERDSFQLSEKACHNINRIIVVLLTFASVTQIGMLADMMMMLAVVLWLWLPECDIYLANSPRLQRLLVILTPMLFYLLSYLTHK